MTSRRAPALIAVAALAGGALAACGSSSSTSSSSSTPAYGATTPGPAAAAPSGSTAQLSADPTGKLKFNVATLHAKAGNVTVQMMNPAGSGVSHGIAVEGHGVDKDSTIVQSGATATVTVTLKAGTYDFYCPVRGHKAAGMAGKLIVS